MISNRLHNSSLHDLMTMTGQWYKCLFPFVWIKKGIVSDLSVVWDKRYEGGILSEGWICMPFGVCHLTNMCDANCEQPMCIRTDCWSTAFIIWCLAGCHHPFLKINARSILSWHRHGQILWLPLACEIGNLGLTDFETHGGVIYALQWNQEQRMSDRNKQNKT